MCEIALANRVHPRRVCDISLANRGLTPATLLFGGFYTCIHMHLHSLHHFSNRGQSTVAVLSSIWCWCVGSCPRFPVKTNAYTHTHIQRKKQINHFDLDELTFHLLGNSHSINFNKIIKGLIWFGSVWVHITHTYYWQVFLNQMEPVYCRYSAWAVSKYG